MWDIYVGVDYFITLSHKEIIEGKEVTVVDKWKPIGAFTYNDRSPELDDDDDEFNG